MSNPIIDSNGTKHWFLDGLLHRVDGPAVEYENGHRVWYLNGQFHREDGPAIEYMDGAKAWYLNGIRHRIDGPAVIRPDGTREWYLDGKWIVKLINDLKEKHPKIYDQLLIYQVMGS